MLPEIRRQSGAEGVQAPALAGADDKTLVRVGGLQVRRDGDQVQVIMDGKPLDWKTVGVEFHAGQPATASLTFMPESEADADDPGGEVPP